MSALDGAPVQQHLRRSLWNLRAGGEQGWMYSAGILGGCSQGGQVNGIIHISVTRCPGRPPSPVCTALSFSKLGESPRTFLHYENLHRCNT